MNKVILRSEWLLLSFSQNTTIQYQGFSAPLKPENNSKINRKQNTNNKNTIPKPKNKSNSPNPPHTPKK